MIEFTTERCDLIVFNHDCHYNLQNRDFVKWVIQ